MQQSDLRFKVLLKVGVRFYCLSFHPTTSAIVLRAFCVFTAQISSPVICIPSSLLKKHPFNYFCRYKSDKAVISYRKLCRKSSWWIYKYTFDGFPLQLGQTQLIVLPIYKSQIHILLQNMIIGESSETLHKGPGYWLRILSYLYIWDENKLYRLFKVRSQYPGSVVPLAMLSKLTSFQLFSSLILTCISSNFGHQVASLVLFLRKLCTLPHIFLQFWHRQKVLFSWQPLEKII